MRLMSVLGVILIAIPLAATAQTIEPGATVRVTTDLQSYRGTVTRVTTDTLVLDTLRLPLHSVSRIQVRRKSASRGLTMTKYAGLGLLIGAATGVIAGPFLTEDCTALRKTTENTAGCLDDLADASIYGKRALQFGLVGAAIGTLVGTLVSLERWEEVPLDRLRVSFAPQRDGRFALGLSVRF